MNKTKINASTRFLLYFIKLHIKFKENRRQTRLTNAIKKANKLKKLTGYRYFVFALPRNKFTKPLTKRMLIQRLRVQPIYTAKGEVICKYDFFKLQKIAAYITK